jgi:hypothetical protein
MKFTKLSLIAAAAVTVATAGGNVAPAAPAPVVEEAFPQWDFSGQAVLYFQTIDHWGVDDLFAQESNLANAGLQLNAVGKFDHGLSVGAQLTGLGTLSLQNGVVSNVMQSADGNLNGGAVTKLWAAWANETTTLKGGRMELPKSLSPFAWSEGWNVFKNTYEAALLVNTSLPGTTLVGAWVSGANQNGVGAWDGNGNWFTHGLHKGASNLNAFNKVNGEDGIWMVTAQNKSIDGLTLTGSFYYAPNLVDNMTQKVAEMDGLPDPVGTDTGNAATIFWVDATYKKNGITVAGQGGSIADDDFNEDTTAWGAKVGYAWNGFSVLAAYSSVDEGDTGVFNVGGVKTPLYTQMILNQGFISSNADTLLVKGTAKLLGGKFIAQYGATTMNDRPIGDTGLVEDIDYNEFDFIYKTKVWNDSTTLFAAYVNQDWDPKEDAQNMIRFWARYNF